MVADFEEESADAVSVALEEREFADVVVDFEEESADAMRDLKQEEWPDAVPDLEEEEERPDVLLDLESGSLLTWWRTSRRSRLTRCQRPSKDYAILSP